MNHEYRGTIVDLRQGKGKKGELTHGRILRNSITYSNGGKLTRAERASLPANGFFVHRSRCAEGSFAEKSLVLFNAADDGQRPMAVDVVLAPAAVIEPDPASSLESAAVEPTVEKVPAQPVFVREAVKVDSSNLVEEQPPLGDYRYEPTMGGLEAMYARTEKDAEAALVGEEAVLVSTTSKATPSPETAWAAIGKPMLAGLVELLTTLATLAFALVRWTWNKGLQFIANRRARKSAA